jgi:CRP-like cAMP-binding protein
VRCLTSCAFYELHKDDFFRLAAKDEKIGYHLWKNLARMLSERLRRINEDEIKLATALTIALSW